MGSSFLFLLAMCPLLISAASFSVTPINPVTIIGVSPLSPSAVLSSNCRAAILNLQSPSNISLNGCQISPALQTNNSLPGLRLKWATLCSGQCDNAHKILFNQMISNCTDQIALTVNVDSNQQIISVSQYVQINSISRATSCLTVGDTYCWTELNVLLVQIQFGAAVAPSQICTTCNQYYLAMSKYLAFPEAAQIVPFFNRFSNQIKLLNNSASIACNQSFLQNSSVPLSWWGSIYYSPAASPYVNIYAILLSFTAAFTAIW